MNSLFLDTHKSKEFSILVQTEKTILTKKGHDAAQEALKYIQELTNNQIDEIIITTGPGSLTGLRIGSALATGLALAKKIKVKGISIWELMFLEYPDAEILFYTGTKKWIYKTLNTEQIINFEELINIKIKQNWITNNQEKLLAFFPKENNINYPEMIILMHKYKTKASCDINLHYPITLF